MWHDIDERALPIGVVSVDKRKSRVVFGMKTVQTWKLDRFQTATPKINGTPGLVAFQLYKDDRGNRQLAGVGKGRKTMQISCQRYLQYADPKRRYLAKRESDGFIVVDFSTPVPPGWTPQHGGGSR